MKKIKTLRKIFSFMTLLFAAYTTNTLGATDSVNNDFCIYVDPLNPYYNPNKLSLNQLEECKIRAATIIEIQSFQYAILKQRFPDAVKAIAKNPALPSAQELDVSIATTKSSSNNNATVNTKKPVLAGTSGKRIPREPIIKDAEDITEVKSKPLYHSDAGNAVDMNYQVIVTQAGSTIAETGKQIAETQIDKIKATEPVRSLSTTEKIMNPNNVTPALPPSSASTVDMILARQTKHSNEQFQQPDQTNIYASLINTNNSSIPTQASSNDMRTILKNVGVISSETSDPVSTILQDNTNVNSTAQKETINTDSLELLQKIKANGQSIPVNPINGLTDISASLPNSTKEENTTQLQDKTKQTKENQIEKFSKSVEIEPVPSI